MATLSKDFSFQKKILWFNASLPVALLISDFLRGQIGPNPPEAFIRTTGVVAILFLALTLCATPISQWTGSNLLIRHRRWLGLCCFYYALIHLCAYSVFDKALNWTDIFADIVKRPFILLGFTGFLMLLPLAVTSTNQMIKRMGGKRWKALHKLTYVVAPVVALHYWLIVKSDLFYPEIFAIIFLILLSYRIWKWAMRPSKPKGKKPLEVS